MGWWSVMPNSSDREHALSGLSSVFFLSLRLVSCLSPQQEVLWYFDEGVRGDMATATAPIKVDAETDRLISNAAHFLQRSKKSVVDLAVREYVENHRAEIQEAALEALRLLDGSTKSAVSLVSGMSSEELEDLGGFDE